MGLTLAKCPACGAELNLETDRDYFYCPHCGSKVMQVDDRIVIEHVNRTINEAEVRKQEFEREKYFHEEQKQAEERKHDNEIGKKLLIVGILLIVACFIVGRFEGSNTFSGVGFWIGIAGAWVALFGFAYFVHGSTSKKSDSDNNQSDIS